MLCLENNILFHDVLTKQECLIVLKKKEEKQRKRKSEMLMIVSTVFYLLCLHSTAAQTRAVI